MAFRHLEPLVHDLAPHYAALRGIRTRKQLQASELYSQIGPEIARVTSGLERGEHASAANRLQDDSRLRVASWNIQRGIRFDELRDALAGDPVLSLADVVILVEVDQGLGRSGNRLVARELADALGMHFVFACSYLTLEDDIGENPGGVENTLALAGCAILSRLPIARAENVDLPELRDKFSSSEKRLGHKRAVLAEVMLPDGPLAIAGCHLDSNASPKQRAAQLAALLDRAVAVNSTRALVGGDFNTSTYDNSSTGALIRDLLHKAFVVGFRGTIERYLEPHLHQERPVFDTLAERGFVKEGFNDRERASYKYDLNTDYAYAIVRKELGAPLARLLRYKLRPWNGVVPVRLDWFGGLGVRAGFARVVDPVGKDGVPVSDHAAIVVDLKL